MNIQGLSMFSRLCIFLYSTTGNAVFLRKELCLGCQMFGKKLCFNWETRWDSNLSVENIQEFRALLADIWHKREKWIQIMSFS